MRLIRRKGNRYVINGGHDESLYLCKFPSELEVRINNHWVRQGGDVDVLYHCGVISGQPVTELFKYPEIQNLKQFVINSHNEEAVNQVRNFCREYSIDFVVDDFRNAKFWIRKYNLPTNFQPFSGMFAALRILFSSRYSFVHLAGMTLHLDTPQDPPGFVGPHELRAHALLVRKLQDEFGRRFTISKTLDESVNKILTSS